MNGNTSFRVVSMMLLVVIMGLPLTVAQAQSKYLYRDANDIGASSTGYCYDYSSSKYDYYDRKTGSWHSYRVRHHLSDCTTHRDVFQNDLTINDFEDNPYYLLRYNSEQAKATPWPFAYGIADSDEITQPWQSKFSSSGTPNMRNMNSSGEFIFDNGCESSDNTINDALLIKNAEIILSTVLNEQSEDAAGDILKSSASDAFDQGQYQQAAQFYLAYLTLIPDNSVQVYNLAMTYEALDLKQQAIRMFVKYLDLEPRAIDMDFVHAKIGELNANSYSVFCNPYKKTQ